MRYRLSLIAVMLLSVVVGLVPAVIAAALRHPTIGGIGLGCPTTDPCLIGLPSPVRGADLVGGGVLGLVVGAGLAWLLAARRDREGPGGPRPVRLVAQLVLTILVATLVAAVVVISEESWPPRCDQKPCQVGLACSRYCPHGFPAAAVLPWAGLAFLVVLVGLAATLTRP